MDPSARTLLILDVDEVLIHSTEGPSTAEYDFLVLPYRVRKRPFVDRFLEIIPLWFEIAVWTNATEGYIDEVMRKLFPANVDPSFVWSRKRCTPRIDYETRDMYWLKNLKKVKRLGYDLRRVLVLEDDPRTMQRSYGNLITVRAFNGDPSDRELCELLPYMQWISGVTNVRVLEKRTWRQDSKKINRPFPC